MESKQLWNLEPGELLKRDAGFFEAALSTFIYDKNVEQRLQKFTTPRVELENDPLEELGRLQAPVGKDDRSSDAQTSDSDDGLDDMDDVDEHSEEDKKMDLFGEGDDAFDSEEQEMMTPYRGQRAKLLEETRKLEEENVTDKMWTLKGEINARSRPENSLLEEDLDFDFTMVPPPVITEQVTESIEDVIRRRVRERCFDNPSLPVTADERTQADEWRERKRRIDLEMTERRDLGQLYEDEFRKRHHSSSAKDQDPYGPNVDPKLRPKYHELEEVYAKLTKALDTMLYRSTQLH
jgi:U3 small nucleolar RNA-associated protein MPP10